MTRRAKLIDLGMAISNIRWARGQLVIVERQLRKQRDLAVGAPEERARRAEIAIHPGMQWGAPCLAGTRLTAEMLAGVWWSGNYTVAEIEDNWPGTTREDVMVACWYSARYGSRAWRARWAAWADEHATALWKHSDGWEAIPMPPQVDR